MTTPTTTTDAGWARWRQRPPGHLAVRLLSDTAFGRGEPTAGEVDLEVEHDELGLPIVGGRTMHGLLRDGWLSMAAQFPHLSEAAARILGRPGDLDLVAIMHLGDAVVRDLAGGSLSDPVGGSAFDHDTAGQVDPDEDGQVTRQWLLVASDRPVDPIQPIEVLRTLTTVRWQTAEDRATGAPATATLRSTRMLVRGLSLRAPLRWQAAPDDAALQVLALCALATRHAGLGRNRGSGHVAISLDGDWPSTVALARQAGRPVDDAAGADRRAAATASREAP